MSRVFANATTVRPRRDEARGRDPPEADASLEPVLTPPDETPGHRRRWSIASSCSTRRVRSSPSPRARSIPRIEPPLQNLVGLTPSPARLADGWELLREVHRQEVQGRRSHAGENSWQDCTSILAVRGDRGADAWRGGCPGGADRALSVGAGSLRLFN